MMFFDTEKCKESDIDCCISTSDECVEDVIMPQSQKSFRNIKISSDKL